MTALEGKEKVQFQQAILPVVATTTDGKWVPAGSCFVFAINDRVALAFSAAHVFEYVVRSEGHHDKSAASMPNILRDQRPPAVDLQHTTLRSIYPVSEDTVYLPTIARVERDGALDVCVCLLVLGDDVPPEITFQRKLAIHSGPIPEGTDVYAVGYAEMGKTKPIEFESTAGALHYQKLAFEHGKAGSYYIHKGPRGNPLGPCFELNVSTQVGMSGGPVIHKGYGDEIVACGVISYGSSFGRDETTMASCLWPSYSFNLPYLAGVQDNGLNLLELEKRGWIDDKSNPSKHFSIKNGPLGKQVQWC